MSAHIKRQIDSVEDNIYFLKRERNELHYQIYVCYRQELLFEYELTLKELDNQYDELKRLEKKYQIELSKERCKHADERYKRAKEEAKRTLEILTSQMQRLVHSENEKKVKEAMEVEQHVEEAATENPIEEVKQVTEDLIEEVKQVEDTEVASEEQVEETMPQLDCFQNVEDHKVVDDIIEIEHIDFIIPKYLLEPPLRGCSFSEFFAPKPLLNKSRKFVLIASSSCMILAFYKTRGRVFFQQGENDEERK